MKRNSLASLSKLSGIIALLAIALILPVTASFVFQDVTVSPAPPLTPGQIVSSASQLVIIPQGGPTTFVGNNQLQLTTELAGARWDVVVLVNGKSAARMPVNGNTVFINGFLLSYPVSSDVAVSVNVNGTVPEISGPGLNIVNAVQLNNAGQTVPGSLQSISEPLTVPSAPAPSTSPPTPPVPTTAMPTRAAGFSAAAGAGALICFCLIARKSGWVRKA